MSFETYTQPTQRGFGRRKEDRLVRDLLRVGQIITSEIDMEALFKIIIDETCHIMEVEHCAIFVHDKEKTSCGHFFAQRQVNSGHPPRPIRAWRAGSSLTGSRLS